MALVHRTSIKDQRVYVIYLYQVWAASPQWHLGTVQLTVCTLHFFNIKTTTLMTNYGHHSHTKVVTQLESTHQSCTTGTLRTSSYQTVEGKTAAR